MSNVKTGSFMQLDAATLKSVGHLGPKDRKTRKGHTRRKETVKLLLAEYEDLIKRFKGCNGVNMSHYVRQTLRRRVVVVISYILGLVIPLILIPTFFTDIRQSGGMVVAIFLSLLLLLLGFLVGLLFRLSFASSAEKAADDPDPDGWYEWLPFWDKAAISLLYNEIEKAKEIGKQIDDKRLELQPLLDDLATLQVVIEEELHYRYQLIEGPHKFEVNVAKDENHDGKTFEVTRAGVGLLSLRVKKWLDVQEKVQDSMKSLRQKAEKLKKR